jgi:hypothetical protein
MADKPRIYSSVGRANRRVDDDIDPHHFAAKKTESTFCKIHGDGHYVSLHDFLNLLEKYNDLIGSDQALSECSQGEWNTEVTYGQ